MTFIQWEFLVFFALVFPTYWNLQRRGQNILLAIVSAVFYGWIHPWFLILLYTSAVSDFVLGQAIHRDPDHKKRYLIASLAVNLGMLGYFKYANFFVENVAAALISIGVEPSISTLGVFLPVGISFYTFQTMSYTIDIYRGKLAPRTNFLDYIVFVSFFPQLVAGPVERASNLLPQFEKRRTVTREQLMSGMSLALWGAVKKMAVADTIAPYVDKVYVLNDPAGPLIWAATLGFTIQILADFSGYTDIARGTARMLGIELLQNFRHPYLARNPSDFWQRWHISFSTWIRDYLYFPLGGSRGTYTNTIIATFGAMMLSGVWHGAAWTFLIWGFYHAALITGYRAVGRRLPDSVSNMPGAHAISVAMMFGFTVIGWAIFRETRIDRLVAIFTTNPFSASTEEWVATAVLMGLCGLVSMPLFAGLAVEKWVLPRLEKSEWHMPAQTTVWAGLAVVIFVYSRDTVTDFVYFQF